METVTLKVSDKEEEIFIIPDEEEIEKNEEDIPEETINFTDLKKDGEKDEE